MMMTIEQRMAQLEARVAQLEARIANQEAKNMTFGPGPSTPYQPTPVSPYPNPLSPWNPPYTITCKMADGTTKEMTFTTPIVAQTNVK
jgi:hypothetical protein